MAERAPKQKKQKNWSPLLVSNNPHARMDEDGDLTPEARIRINRPARVPIDPIRGAWATIKVDKASITLEVTNLSSHGLGLSVANAQFKSFVPGAIFKGTIEFGDYRFPISFKVIHVTEGTAGCTFTDRDEPYVLAFVKWFSAEIAASRLRRMNQLILKEEADGKPIYYFGDGNELFIVESTNHKASEKPRLLRFHAMILGNYFEAESNRPLKYGHAFVDARERDALSYKGSEMIRYSSEIPAEMVNLFGRFIDSIHDLESWHKTALLSALATREE